MIHRAEQRQRESVCVSGWSSEREREREWEGNEWRELEEESTHAEKTGDTCMFGLLFVHTCTHTFIFFPYLLILYSPNFVFWPLRTLFKLGPPLPSPSACLLFSPCTPCTHFQPFLSKRGRVLRVGKTGKKKEWQEETPRKHGGKRSGSNKGCKTMKKRKMWMKVCRKKCR